MVTRQYAEALLHTWTHIIFDNVTKIHIPLITADDVGGHQVLPAAQNFSKSARPAYDQQDAAG